MLAARIFFRSRSEVRRHLDELVVVDELDGLLEAHLARRDEANGLVGRRRAHVRLLLFLGDVDVEVVRPRVLADDHALVDVHGAGR